MWRLRQLAAVAALCIQLLPSHACGLTAAPPCRRPSPDFKCARCGNGTSLTGNAVRLLCRGTPACLRQQRWGLPPGQPWHRPTCRRPTLSPPPAVLGIRLRQRQPVHPQPVGALLRAVRRRGQEPVHAVHVGTVRRRRALQPELQGAVGHQLPGLRLNRLHPAGPRLPSVAPLSALPVPDNNASDARRGDARCRLHPPTHPYLRITCLQSLFTLPLSVPAPYSPCIHPHRTARSLDLLSINSPAPPARRHRRRHAALHGRCAVAATMNLPASRPTYFMFHPSWACSCTLLLLDGLGTDAGEQGAADEQLAAAAVAGGSSWTAPADRRAARGT